MFKLDIKAKNLDVITTVQQTDFFAGDSSNYLKEKSTTNLISDIKVNNLNINAQDTIIRGANIKVNNQININSQILDIASVKDSTFSKSHSESSGGLFGGKSESTTTRRTQTNIQSTLNAKNVNIRTQITGLTASKIKAKVIDITTNLLNLVADKDLDFYQHQSSSSGMITKKIKNKGHNIETAVQAELGGKLILNSQSLTNEQNQQLEKLNSNNLNQQLAEKLKDKGINLQDIKLNNQKWDESTTTLSGLGKIIVQVAVTIATGSAGTGFVNAAIVSAQNQILSAMAESIITGNSLNLDPKAILTAALTAGATEYATAQYGVDNYNPNTTFAKNLQNGLQNTAIETTVQTAINGGSLRDNLKDNITNSVITTTAARGANLIGDNRQNLGELGHKLSHATLGCVGAKASGKDCESGAIGAVAVEVIAEQIDANIDTSHMTKQELEQYKKDIKDLARVGTAVVSQGLDKDVEVADRAGVNAIENNFIVHVPGTYAQAKDVDEAFKKRLKEFYQDDNLIVIDNGKGLENNKKAREELADKVVAEVIQAIQQNPDEPIRLTGHSHGGNVQKIVTQKLVEQGYQNIIDDMMFLATPVREDYQINNPVLSSDAKVLNVYDTSDAIQSLGGVDNLGISKKDRENFPAKQIISNNLRVTNIKIETPNKFSLNHIVNPIMLFVRDELYGDHIDMDSEAALDKINEKLNE